MAIFQWYFEGGDAWASVNTINYLCQKVGIKSYARYAGNDPGTNSGHRNAIAYIDKKYYICEAGYAYYRLNRPYNVSEEPLGYSTKSIRWDCYLSIWWLWSGNNCSFLN